MNFPEVTIFYWSKRDKEWRMHMYDCLSDVEVAEVCDLDGTKPAVAAVGPASQQAPESGFVLHEVPTEGDGHITRFSCLYPEYQKYVDRFGPICTVLSGPRSRKIDLPGGTHFRHSGLQLHYNKSGGLDVVASADAYFRNIQHVVEEARSIARLIPRFKAIVSDYGPTLKLAYQEATKSARAEQRLNSLPELFSISHQAALESQQENVPRPRPSMSFDMQQRAIDMMRGTQSIGFHYERYNDAIVLPMIRPEMYDLVPTFDGDFILVYLRGDARLIVDQLSKARTGCDWRVYHRDATKVEQKAANVWFHPTDRQAFVADIGHCKGVLADAGFGMTSECLHLGLPLACRPVPNHLEQQCNAAALEEISQVQVVYDLAAVDTPNQLANYFRDHTTSQPLERTGRLGRVGRYPFVAEEVVERLTAEAASKTNRKELVKL